MLKRIANNIHHEIEKANFVLLLPHKNPDPDALGSLLAFYEYIQKMGKTVYMYSTSPISQKYNFLPKFSHIETNPQLFSSFSPDLIITLDSGDADRSGLNEILPKIQKRPMIINIDHHQTNTLFGDINLVKAKSSSTCELLFYFFQENTIPLTQSMATNLIAGIITDTDNFTNSATNYSCLNVTSSLIQKGAKHQKIIEKLYKDKSIGILKLWGEIFKRMQYHAELDIVFSHIKYSDYEEYNITEEDAEGFTNFLNNVNEGIAGFIFKEKEDGTIRIGLRTTKDHVDVSVIAKHFGGGGHKKAAGFSHKGPLEQAQEELFALLQNKALLVWKQESLANEEKNC
ncbi:MAG: bifunctional oligoribonuclease/PAP phosphatase NrnA [Candidatus Magasanikbacteria bacterium]